MTQHDVTHAVHTDIAPGSVTHTQLGWHAHARLGVGVLCAAVGARSQWARAGTAISQPSPSYPAQHTHVPEGRHRPRDEQSSGHYVFWLQLSPLQPAAQMHTPLAVARVALAIAMGKPSWAAREANLLCSSPS